jgi:hypothetical protein
MVQGGSDRETANRNGMPELDRVLICRALSLGLGENVGLIYQNTSYVFFQPLILVYT